MVQIKLCGFTEMEAAKAAVEAGTDAIGFVFTNSKRRVSPEKAREIIASIDPFVTTVGVFVNEELKLINEIAEYSRLDLLQLHGSESPEYCRRVIRPVIKTIKVCKASDLDMINKYKNVTRGILLDSHVPGVSGGTGKSFPWEYVTGIQEKHPIILAGGLTVDNVEEAILKVRPAAVDVSSGVETDGVKDPQKIFEFVRRVQNFNILGQSSTKKGVFT